MTCVVNQAERMDRNHILILLFMLPKRSFTVAAIDRWYLYRHAVLCCTRYDRSYTAGQKTAPLNFVKSFYTEVIIVTLHTPNNLEQKNIKSLSLEAFLYCALCFVKFSACARIRYQRHVSWNVIVVVLNINEMSCTGSVVKNGPFLKVHNWWRRKASIHQNVKFFIKSKTGILNIAIFKYYLHKFREATLHRKYQLI